MTGDLARVEDPALLCGQGQFLDDLDPLPGTLVATIVRSPYPHARITGFDARAALASPGVAAVIGPAQTAELIDVDYEELPAVTGTQAALATGAPRLHPDAESNVATDRTFSFGPVQAAFAAAGHVVSGDYSFPRYSSMPMECYCVVANWAETAEGPAVEAWVNFHGPFSMVPVLAGALGVPAPAARARGHRRQLRHQGGHLPLRRTDGAGQQARRAPGAVDRGPAGAPGGILGGRGPADAVRGRGDRGRDRHRAARRPGRQRGRLPAAARAVHAVPLLREHRRRLPHPGGAHPGPCRSSPTRCRPA
jgi:hypothetical protein